LELAGILREAGYAVAVCPGPGSAERCPLSGAEGCAVAHGADVVVSGLAIRRPEVLELLRTRVPRTPLVVLADKDTAPALPDGCLRVGVPVDPRELVSTVADAVAVKQREPER
jgi:hypothetical protein